MGQQSGALPSSVAAFLWLVGLALVGAGLGWVFLFSASYPVSANQSGNELTIAYRQLLFLTGGLALFIAAIFCPLGWLQRGAWLLHGFVLLLLILTLKFGVRAGGAGRWLAMGHWQLQPSEFAKVTLVLALAATMARWWEARGGVERMMWWLVSVGLWITTAFLVVLEPHLSGGIILAGIGAFALLFARVPVLLWLMTLIAVLTAGYLARPAFVHPYQQKRLQSAHGLNWGDERRLHYQSRQATLALGAGGWFGRGLFQSRQKFLFLPSAHNDFIFAVIGEEWGFIGSVGVLAFFGLLLYWSFRLASACADPFLSGTVGGLGLGLWLQAMLHIAVNIGLLPPTGIPLPFVSAGGSSLWSTLLAMGLITNVARHLAFKGRAVSDAMGDGWRRDGRTHLSRHRSRQRRPQTYP